MNEIEGLSNDPYPAAYGRWAGFPAGHKPDVTRCCVEVADGGRWPRYHQCSKKRGHGPGLAYCKQHDPDVVTVRRKAADARSAAKWNAERYGWNGKAFFKVLQKIADGHNDARGLAQETIAEFLKGEHK